MLNGRQISQITDFVFCFETFTPRRVSFNAFNADLGPKPSGRIHSVAATAIQYSLIIMFLTRFGNLFVLQKRAIFFTDSVLSGSYFSKHVYLP